MATRRTTTNPDAVAAAEAAFEWRSKVNPANGSETIPDPESPGPLIDYEETAVDRVARLLDSLTADDKASVKLYRIIANTAKREWCRDYTPAEFESGGLSMIRNEWGAGQFEIRLYGTHPQTGNFGVIARDTINIAAPMNATVQTVAQAPNELAQVLKTMQEQQAALIEAIKQRPDPMQGMKETLGLMVMMREAMGMGAQPAQAQGMGDAIKLIRELREVSEEINPQPKSESDNLIGMLGPIVELVKAQMGNQPQVQPQPQPQPIQYQPPMNTPVMIPGAHAPITPNPSHIEPAPVDNPFSFLQGLTPEQQGFIMNEMIKAFNELLALAQAGKPASEGAEFIADKLPDELVELIDRPDCVDLVIGLQPQAEPYRAWLTDAVKQAIPLLFEDEPVPDAENKSQAG